MRIFSISTLFVVITVNFFLFTSCSLSTKGRLHNTQNIDSSSYTLIWSDEFATDGGFDTTRWSYSPRGKVAWNKFLTHSPSYVWQKDDNLHLRMDNAVIEGDDVPIIREVFRQKEGLACDMARSRYVPNSIADGVLGPLSG